MIAGLPTFITPTPLGERVLKGVFILVTAFCFPMKLKTPVRYLYTSFDI